MTLVAETLMLDAYSAPVTRIDPVRASGEVRPSRLQSSESTRALLGLLRLSQTAAREMQDPSDDSTFAGVISKGVLRSLLGTLHQRHSSTLRHSRRVALVAFGLANHLGWDGRQLRVLEVAGLLHDIGKIGVPDTVLEKPGRLSPEEIELITLHNNVGFDVLQACRVDRQIQEVISQSQQAYCPDLDPSGISGLASKLHLGARILAVADAYDSLATEQPHRRAKVHQEIMEVLTEGSGTQFDANIVSALARWVQQDGVPLQELPDDDEMHPANVSSPVEIREADSVGLIFSYLHTLERLYDGFHLVDTDGKILIWNRRAERLLGRTPEEMLGQRWSAELLGYRHLDERPMTAAETPMLRAIETGRTSLLPLLARHGNGHAVQIELQAMPLFDDQGRLQGVAEFYRDLARNNGKHSSNFRDLKLAATRDALTNVANRRELETQLVAMIDGFTDKSRDPFSVIFADADHFKRVNDTYGHAVGDVVLQRLGGLLSRHFRGEDLVARWGGEEIALGLYGMSRVDGVAQVASALETWREETFSTPGQPPLRVTFSGGVARYGEDGDDLRSLYRAADEVLYRAKAFGGNRILPVGWQQNTVGTVDVVVVENDETLSELLSEALATRGLRCLTVSDGPGAIALLCPADGPRPNAT